VPPHRGIARVIVHGPRVREVALTIDDGLCPACAARIIDTLLRTGAHATIFPNGRYARSWDPLATKIRRLLANGQLTIGDHTFNHYDALEESPAAFRADVQADEIWVERTFGVSARPFLRPPYGAYDAQTVAIAGQLGFTKVIMWSGTVADSTPHTIPYILHAIRYWAKPGAIILMHANYPATSIALPQILGILRALRLRPVTLAQLLAA
jgi:peptidoglycan/xylan/chitin deacetylase (PgdA/CDA1 family)